MSGVPSSDQKDPVAVHRVVTPGPRPDAPVVVLSNSLGATHRMWDAQVGPLSQHFTMVRYDTRGHGGSPVPVGPYTIDQLSNDLLALVDSLPTDRVHLVGLSLGGMTAMRFAATHPDRVDRLAVLCTSALLEPAQAWHDRAALVRRDGTGAVAESVVNRWYSESFLAAEPQRVAAAQAMVAQMPAEGYAGCCEAIAAMDLRADLPSITAPTLAISGDEDPATPPAHLQRIADAVVDGRQLTLSPGAHLVNDEQPDAVTHALLEHLLG